MICQLDGTFEGSDIYKCENEFNYVFKQGENFVVGFLGDPREKSQIAWSHKVSFKISQIFLRIFYLFSLRTIFISRHQLSMVVRILLLTGSRKLVLSKSIVWT